MPDIDEIIVALRNALERGQSINSAKQSLINAGYSEISVNNAANNLANSPVNQLMLNQAQLKPSENLPGRRIDNTIKSLPEYVPTPSDLTFGKKPVNMKKFVTLIIIIILLGALAVYFIKFKK